MEPFILALITVPLFVILLPIAIRVGGLTAVVLLALALVAGIALFLFYVGKERNRQYAETAANQAAVNRLVKPSTRLGYQQYEFSSDYYMVGFELPTSFTPHLLEFVKDGQAAESGGASFEDANGHGLSISYQQGSEDFFPEGEGWTDATGFKLIDGSDTEYTGIKERTDDFLHSIGIMLDQTHAATIDITAGSPVTLTDSLKETLTYDTFDRTAAGANPPTDEAATAIGPESPAPTASFIEYFNANAYYYVSPFQAVAAVSTFTWIFGVLIAPLLWVAWLSRKGIQADYIATINAFGKPLTLVVALLLIATALICAANAYLSYRWGSPLKP